MPDTTLVDSNVLLDIATDDETWRDWSTEKLRDALRRGRVAYNAIILAEISGSYASEAQRDDALPKSFEFLALPRNAAWVAFQAYRQYREHHKGPREHLLPDFYIGAHAEVSGLTLLTRDAGRYQTYFPSVDLITP